MFKFCYTDMLSATFTGRSTVSMSSTSTPRETFPHHEETYDLPLRSTRMVVPSTKNSMFRKGGNKVEQRKPRYAEADEETS